MDGLRSGFIGLGLTGRLGEPSQGVCHTELAKPAAEAGRDPGSNGSLTGESQPK